MTLFDSIAQSIATMEGFYVAGSIAQRNHNPGNVRLPGQPQASGYTLFPDDSTGWAALYADIQAKFRTYPEYTFLQFFQRYAPSSDSNDPYNYASFVVSRLNNDVSNSFTTNTTLSQAAAIANGGDTAGDTAGSIDAGILDLAPAPNLPMVDVVNQIPTPLLIAAAFLVTLSLVGGRR